MYLFDPASSIELFAGVGLKSATREDIGSIHRLAKAMIGGQVADEAALWRVQSLMHGAALYVYRERGEITGFLAWLPLSPEGVEALIAGLFNGLDPAASHLCAVGAQGGAAYGWGYAGRTRRATAAVIKGTYLARNDMCGAMPFFTRAATADGARILSGRLECLPFRDIPGLFWSEPTVSPVEKAA